MLRRKAHHHSQPSLLAPQLQIESGAQGGASARVGGGGESNRTSLISVEEVNQVSSRSRGYEITSEGNSNMKVVVRVRPENEMELRNNCETVVKILDEHVLAFDPKEDNDPRFQGPQPAKKRRALLSRKRRDLRFAFDRVFDENSTQVEVFEHTTKSVINGLLDGINCSVFAYGATGAGKTHTMLGSLENPGVMFLTTMELYRKIDELKHEKNCQVAVTYLEVYNETIRDLLSPSGPLAVREDSSKGLVVSGLTQHQPTSAQDLLQMLENGNRNRTQHPTDANATSSRSHAVFQVFVNQKSRSAGLSAEVTQGKMSLIDLAGSERATVTTNRGARLREGANINKSLLALGNCINALASNKGKTSHVPYRNSKLTRLLKDSLGGNCKTVMIANISPSSLSYEDTYNTLKYADRAKQIKTKLVRNIVNVDYHVTRYRTIVVGLQKEIEELKSQLHISARPPFDLSEVDRLKALVQNVYGERAQLRKGMADLDAIERDTLLRVFRKERDLKRIEILTGDDHKMSKVRGKLDFLYNHLKDVKEQKTTVHHKLTQNNEGIGRVLTEINSSVSSDAENFPVLRTHVDLTLDARKLEAENSHQWKQIKHLLKYIKNQEKDISRTEKILTLSLELVSKQYQLLQATHCLTPVVQDLYQSLVRQVEGDKEVAWMDLIQDSLQDVSISSFANSHQSLMDTIIAHNSPPRKASEGRYSSPINSASLGLLTVSSCSTTLPPFPSKRASPNSKVAPKSPIPCFTLNKPSTQHPLTNRLVAASPNKNSPSPLSSLHPHLQQDEEIEIIGLAGKVLNSPMTSPRLNRGKFDSRKNKKRNTPSPIPPLVEEDMGRNKSPAQSSPITSPRNIRKRVVFTSPPPVIQETEEEVDCNEKEIQRHQQQQQQMFTDTSHPGLPVNKTLATPTIPTPPPRRRSPPLLSTAEANTHTITKVKEKRTVQLNEDERAQSKTKTSSISKKSDVKVNSTPQSRYSSSPIRSKGSPKSRLNLAELTSISQSTVTTTTTSKSIELDQQQQPVAPMTFQSPMINAFEDDFVSSSYPSCSSSKTHVPLGKSLSIENPTYSVGKNGFSYHPKSPFRPPPPPLISSPPHAFKSIPNQHPAFPPPPQHLFTTGPTSPVPPKLPQKPAFLPVSQTPIKRNDYRSPVNIPIHPSPSLPLPPIPSPSTLSRSRSAFRSTSSASSGSQLSDSLTQRHGVVLHPSLLSGDTSVQVTKTTKSHRYSLTSPTQVRENLFLSSKEKENGSSFSSNHSSDLNSTFTISSSSEGKQRYAVLEPANPTTTTIQTKEKSTKTHQKKQSPSLVKPLGVLQVGMTDSMGSHTGSTSSTSSAEKRQPNYLALTKSAAFKKVQRVAHHMKNHKENCDLPNGIAKSQSMKTKIKPLVTRSVSNRSHSVSTAS